MKLLRFGQPGHERPAILDADGIGRDLGDLLPDLHPRLLAPATLRALRAIDPVRLPRIPDGTRIGPPVADIGKFIAIGLNYHAHAAETGNPAPTQPVVFAKWTSCIGGPDDDIVYPHPSCKLDWEVELGIVIGSQARHVAEEDALAHVAGYCLANDVSDRHYQREGGAGQWGKGKGFDSFGPIGPWLITTDEVPDPQNLDLWLAVNGETVQRSSTSDMIFSCARLVSECSRFMTLEPGDLIITGTPPGVGLGMKPPRFLQPGDVVTLGATSLGMQRQTVVPAGAASR